MAPRTDDAASLAAATELLGAELPDPRFEDDAYLRWLYLDNPCGRGFWGNRLEDDRLMGHYAVIPQCYRSPAGPVRMVFSLNAVTRSEGQRRGHFVSIGEEVYERAREWGADGVIGVSNDNSTPPVVKKLDFRLMGPLPVKVTVPRGSTGHSWEHHEICGPFLDSADFDRLAVGLDRAPRWGWRNRWTPEYLHWRLSSPNSAGWHLHADDNLVVVSTRSEAGPLPVAVILKLMARRQVRERLSGRVAVNAVCHHLRTPLAVYAGFNADVRVPGVQPPRRIQPAPLNLIYRGLSAAAPNLGFRLDTFEFLDFDAY